MLCRTPAFLFLPFLPLFPLLGLGCSSASVAAERGDAGDAAAPTCPAKETVRSQTACTQEGLDCASVERSFPEDCHRPANPSNPETGCTCTDGKWQCIKFAIYCGEAGAPTCPVTSDVRRGAECFYTPLTCPADERTYPDACSVPIANNPTVDCACTADGHWQCPTSACPVEHDAGALDGGP